LRLFFPEIGFNVLSAGIVIGIMIVPYVSSLSEDAMRAVPNHLREGSYAMGATKIETALKVVFPSALSGISSAYILGVSRAIGETMIVLLVCSASVMSWNIFDSARSITTTIAAEMAEAVSGGHHYRILFLLGALLFAVTFITNFIGDVVIHHFKAKLEGKRG